MASTNTNVGDFVLEVAESGKALVEAYNKLVAYRKVQDRRLETLSWTFTTTTKYLTDLGTTIIRYANEYPISDDVVRPIIEPCKTALDKLLLIMSEATTSGVWENQGTVAGKTVVAETDPWFLITMGLGGKEEARLFWRSLDDVRDRTHELNDIVKFNILKNLDETRTLNADEATNFELLKSQIPHIVHSVEQAKEEEEKKAAATRQLFLDQRRERSPPPPPPFQRRNSEALSDVTLTGPRNMNRHTRFAKDIDCQSVSSFSSDAESTAPVDEKYEEWTLRWVPPQKRVDRSRSILGIKFKTYFEDEGFWGTDAELRTQKELKDKHEQAIAGLSPEQHKSAMQKAIQAIPKNGGNHVDNLVEERNDSSSNENVKRDWVIVAVTPKARFPYSSAKKWGKDVMTTDWVITIRGSTISREERTRSNRWEDPWQRRYRSPVQDRHHFNSRSRGTRRRGVEPIYYEEAPYVRRPRSRSRETEIIDIDVIRPRLHVPREVSIDQGFIPATVMIGQIPSKEEAEKKMEDIWAKMSGKVEESAEQAEKDKEDVV